MLIPTLLLEPSKLALSILSILSVHPDDLVVFKVNRNAYIEKHVEYCIMYNVLSYQLKLIKMRAELASLNHCAVPFFKPRHRQLVMVLLYNVYCKVAVYQHLSIGVRHAKKN